MEEQKLEEPAPKQPTPPQVPQVEEQDCIDPYAQIKAGNPFPLIASIKHVDLNQLVDENTPLLHHLCKLYLPLGQILQGRDIEFTKTVEGKTPLHFAIESGDIQAVYWCLNHSNQVNPRNVLGMTPAMEALKRGFRAGFLLCVHYGHVDEELPHVAAFVNDVWALKFLKTIGVDLYKKNPRGITPMGVAAHHFSYEAVYYLAQQNPSAIDSQELIAASKSTTMLKQIAKIKKNHEFGQSMQQKIFSPCFLVESLLLVSLFFLINSIPEFRDLYPINIAISIQFLILVIFYAPRTNHGPKRWVDILAMMKPPNFPQGQVICPECVQIKDEGYEHCEVCGVCVRRFHFHNKRGTCVYEKNQGRWFFKELLWFIILNMAVNKYLYINSELFTMYHFQRLEAIYLLYNNVSIWWTGVPLYLLCTFWLVKKLLLLIALFHMIFTGYTYQEMMHNERYRYLYRPIQVGDKYQNKRIYLFDEGVTRGIRRAISNAIRFFF